METWAEMDFIARLYESVKTDLHTLLVENSTDKLDYIGELNIVGDKPSKFVSLDYSVVNPTQMDYMGLLGACHLIVNKMVRHDMRLWTKDVVVEEFFGVSPNVDSTSHIRVSLKVKA